MRALRVAVARAQLGARGVAGVLALAAVLVHLHKVEGTVEAAREVGDVDVEGELFVLELEHLVVLVVLHQVRPRAHVLGVGALHDEREINGIAARLDAVGVLVLLVRAFEDAALGARLRVRAQRRIPLVAMVAVCGLTIFVDPPPVGVDSDLASLLLAAPDLVHVEVWSVGWFSCLSDPGFCADTAQRPIADARVSDL